MSVCREDVIRLAEMTRIGLKDGEADRLTAELDMILDAVNRLQAVDTSQISADSADRRLTNGARSDEVAPSLMPSEVLSNAPEQHGGFFVVPAVLAE